MDLRDRMEYVYNQHAFSMATPELIGKVQNSLDLLVKEMYPYYDGNKIVANFHNLKTDVDGYMSDLSDSIHCVIPLELIEYIKTNYPQDML